MEMAMALAKRHESPPPVLAMIRPRAGDFSYSALELETMARDIKVARRLGLAGVVFGVTDAERGDLAVQAMLFLTEAAKGDGEGGAPALSVTLHRAIDLTPDPPACLLALIQALPPRSLDRVLTSGGALSAWEGRRNIARMVEAVAGTDVNIMAGAGVCLSNVSQLVATTGVREVHASCRSVGDIRGSGRGAVAEKVRAFGFSGGQGGGVVGTDAAKIEALALLVHDL